MKFSIETEKNGSLTFLDMKIFRETITFLLVISDKRCLVCLVWYTLISSVLFHLCKSLVWYTPYSIVVLIYILTF